MAFYSRTFEFTAFTEADLLGSGDSSLGRGDTFVMPAIATTEFSVRDNDPWLSGDIHKKSWARSEDTGRWQKKITEHARDPFGQEASANGVPLEGQIYAEKRLVLRGDDGKTYQLIEIEVEGGSALGRDEAYFTFLGAVPPPNVTLEVKRCSDVVFGLKYDKLGAGEAADPETASLGGRYFCDVDADDLDTGDPSVPRALVTLLTADGKVVARTKTDADGTYEFTDLAAGDYVVQFATDDAPGKAFVRPSSDSNGSDVIDPERGLTDLISLGQGEVVNGIDAGIVYVEPTAVIAGRYFCDDDADDLDREDPSVPGALVTLTTADGKVVARTKTDADGNYEFTDLAAGDYVVQFSTDDAPGKAFVSPSSDSNGSDVVDPERGLTDLISLGQGEVVNGIDAGIVYVKPECPTPSAVLIDFLDAAFAFDFPSDKDSHRDFDAMDLEDIVRELPDKVLHDIAGDDRLFGLDGSPENGEFCQLSDLIQSAFADRFDFA